MQCFPLEQWLNSLPVCVSVAQSCLTLCDSMDCSPPGSSVHGILQARILEWVAIPFSGGSSWHRDRTWVSYMASRFLTSVPPGEHSVPVACYKLMEVHKQRVTHLWHRLTVCIASTWESVKPVLWVIRIFLFNLWVWCLLTVSMKLPQANHLHVKSQVNSHTRHPWQSFPSLVC